MPKNIVICCDGTANQFGEQNSNVVKLYAVLDKEHPNQVAFYDPGVGTISDPGLRVPLGKKISVILGLLFGYGLQKNVSEAYSYLMEQYEPGDNIFLFGFSRGAYTVRVLAGFIHLMGLLEKGCQHLIPYAWDIFSIKTKEDEKVRNKKFKLAGKFKKNYGRHVPIAFVGVWDTVSSIGWVTRRKTYPYTADNPSVVQLRHAIAIDERRAYYDPNFWRKSDRSKTEVKQVWFAGVHSDVGGSYPEAESGLAKIALQWMIREARVYGLHIDEERYRRVVLGEGKDGEYVGPDHKAPMHRSLKSFWWVMEFMLKNDPMEKGKFWLPRGRRRIIPVEKGTLLHQSVLDKLRDDATYRPKNLPEEYSIEQMD